MFAFRVKFVGGAYDTVWADCEADAYALPGVVGVWIIGGGA